MKELLDGEKMSLEHRHNIEYEQLVKSNSRLFKENEDLKQKMYDMDTMINRMHQENDSTQHRCNDLIKEWENCKADLNKEL